MKVFRRLRRFLSAPGPVERGAIFAKQSQTFVACVWTVRLFYIVQLFFLPSIFEDWVEWRQVTVLEPLWPVFWVEAVGISVSVDFIVALFAIGLFGAAAFPQLRSFRVLAFAGLLLYSAFRNSFGKIGHSTHAWIYVSFVLMFLPSIRRDGSSGARIFRQKYLSVILGAQAMVLMLYSLSGFWKVWAAIMQTSRGELSALSVDGFSYQIANRLLQTDVESLFGPFLIQHSWIGAISFLAVIYVELFAVLALFRHPLHRWWGLGLIGLHLGSELILSVGFSKNILLLGILLVSSPFQPATSDVKGVLRLLPGAGLLYPRGRTPTSAE